MSLPIFRSDFDPLSPEEGALDPLGLAATAERIALYTSPGLLDRQRRIRFLTFVALGLLLKEESETETDDLDCGFWEAYEWIITSALIANPPKGGLLGVPGSGKAEAARRKNLPLNRERYLSASSVFGFHGVYKFLANHLKIETPHGRGENALLLATAWEKDQNMTGFVTRVAGPGYDLRRRMIRAILQTRENQKCSESWGSSFLQEVALVFDPNEIGPTERIVLTQMILHDERAHRKQIVQSMKEFGYPSSEAEFFQELEKKASPSLQIGVRAALDYEELSFLLNSAFDSILARLTERQHGVSISELYDIPAIQIAKSKIAGAHERALDSLQKIPSEDWARRMLPLAWCSETHQLDSFVTSLIQHHFENQKRKPPNGKLAWLTFTENKKLIIRPGYVREANESQTFRFDHSFRTRPLYDFMRELGELNHEK